jgi:hypothetical protein
MAKPTESKNRPLVGVFLSIIELRKTNNVGAIALADMFVDTYENKYGRIPHHPEHGSAREAFVLKTLLSNRSHIDDQDLLGIVDQLIKVLEKTN